VPAPAFLVGQLELELAFLVLRPAAPELVEPSVGVSVDCAVPVDIDQPRLLVIRKLRSRSRLLGARAER
jgi:hypothetical protein